MNLDLVTLKDPKSPVSEAYRTLRTNLQFSNVDNNLKAICVTSASSSEGKTTTITNLAETFAQAGNKVILIDADLRKPLVHKAFKVSNASGLTNVLAQHIDYKEVLQIAGTNIHILTSGPIPPNPSELLGSKSMKKLIEQLKVDYDVVLIDAPPVGIVTDAAIVSTIVDGVLLVVASGKTEIDGAKRAKQLLENVNANIIGSVMTMIPVQSNGYYGYQYYRYYEGHEPKKNKRWGRKR